MRRLRAVPWDVDGTLAETERDGHRVAFNNAFELFGLPWRWDQACYSELLTLTGGRERLLHDMHSRADAPRLAGERESLARELHRSKNGFYAELVLQGGNPLRASVLSLMQQCRREGMRMGVATTTSRSNVEALMKVHLGQHWNDWFEVLVCGEDVERKKPSSRGVPPGIDTPGLAPLDTLAIEDSPWRGGCSPCRRLPGSGHTQCLLL